MRLRSSAELFLEVGLNCLIYGEELALEVERRYPCHHQLTFHSIYLYI